MNFQNETAVWVATGILIILGTLVVYGVLLIARHQLRKWRGKR